MDETNAIERGFTFYDVKDPNTPTGWVRLNDAGELEYSDESSEGFCAGKLSIGYTPERLVADYEDWSNGYAMTKPGVVPDPETRISTPPR